MRHSQSGFRQPSILRRRQSRIRQRAKPRDEVLRIPRITIYYLPHAKTTTVMRRGLMHPQCFGNLLGSGSGCQNVVDQENVFAGDAIGVPGFESTANIGTPALRVRLCALPRRSAHSADIIRITWNAQALGQAACQHRALIKASLPIALRPVKWDRHNYLCVYLLQTRCQMPRPKRADYMRQVVITAVFEPEDDFTQQSIIGPQAQDAIIGESASLAMDAAIGQIQVGTDRLRAVRARRLKVRGKGLRTSWANTRVNIRKEVAADPTDVRIKKRDQAVFEGGQPLKRGQRHGVHRLRECQSPDWLCH